MRVDEVNCDAPSSRALWTSLKMVVLILMAENCAVWRKSPGKGFVVNLSKCRSTEISHPATASLIVFSYPSGNFAIQPWALAWPRSDRNKKNRRGHHPAAVNFILWKKTVGRLNLAYLNRTDSLFTIFKFRLKNSNIMCWATLDRWFVV